MNLVTKNDFDKLIKKGKIVVDFFADWCGPCQRLAPVFESLSTQYKDIKFVKANIDESKELAERFDVMSIPCVIFFKDGKEVDRMVGFSGEEEVREKLDSL